MDDDPAVDYIFSQIDVNSAAQRYILAGKCGITRFQDFQKEAIDATFLGKDVLIVQPTGKGKKPLFSIPCNFFRKHNVSYYTNYKPHARPNT